MIVVAKKATKNIVWFEAVSCSLVRSPKEKIPCKKIILNIYMWIAIFLMPKEIMTLGGKKRTPWCCIKSYINGEMISFIQITTKKKILLVYEFYIRLLISIFNAKFYIPLWSSKWEISSWEIFSDFAILPTSVALLHSGNKCKI